MLYIYNQYICVLIINHEFVSFFQYRIENGRVHKLSTYRVLVFQVLKNFSQFHMQLY